jgi:predicted metal-dependent hydrolase
MAMSTTQSAEPARIAERSRAEITVRRPEMALSSALPRHWYGGRPFATHFFDALSSTFPDGEAFFVRSVQHFRDRIDDPELARAVRGFAGQEAQHRHQHAAHLDLLLGHGYTALAVRNRIMSRALRFFERHAPRASLASTASLEHLTAILARRLLGESERFCAEMDPRMARLWQWHALEEAEHKAVAFDVLRVVAPEHRRRVVALTINSLGLVVEILDRTLYMLWKDGLLFRRDTWRDAWRFLVGRDGFLRGLGADYRSWFRRDFHPDDVDDGPLVEIWRSRIAA